MDSNKSFELTDDKGVNCLLIKLIYIVIGVESCSPFKNVTHSTSFVFSETIPDMINTRESRPNTTISNKTNTLTYI